MHRLLAIGEYDERYVIPTAHAEASDPEVLAHDLEERTTAVLPRLRGRPGNGRLRTVGRVLRQPRTPSPSRTSTCSSSGSVPTPSSTPRTPGVQPAQLGRQGRARPVPAVREPAPGRAAHRASGRGARTRRPPSRPSREPATAPAPPHRCDATPAGDRPPGGVGAAGLPGRRAGRRLPLAAARCRALPDGGGRTARLRPPRAHALRAAAAGLRRDLRPAPAMCLHLTYYAFGDTRKRGMALLRFNHAVHAAPGAEFSERELPDHLAVVLRVRRHRRPRLGASACSPSTVPGRAHPPRSGRRRGPLTWRVLDAVCAILPRPRTADLDAVTASWPRRGRPRKRSGLDPFAPPVHGSAPARMSAADATVLLWVIVAVRVHGGSFVVGHFWRYRYDKFGWTTRSSPALRAPAAAAGQPAVPLRHPVRPRRARHGPRHPGVLDRGGRASPRPPTTVGRRHRRRRRHRHRSSGWPSSSTAGGPSGRSSRPPPGTTSPCTSCWPPRHRARPGQHGAGQPHRPPTTTGTRVRRGSAASSTSTRNPSSWPQRRSASSCTRLAALRCSRLALHPAGPRVQRPRGYLTRPYIVYRSRAATAGTRDPRRGWEPVQRPR